MRYRLVLLLLTSLCLWGCTKTDQDGTYRYDTVCHNIKNNLTRTRSSQLGHPLSATQEAKLLQEYSYYDCSHHLP